MTILFAISVLALVALLWAALSAAHHIRRARRRKRRVEGLADSSFVPGRIGLTTAQDIEAEAWSFTEVTPFVEAGVSREAAIPEPLVFRDTFMDEMVPEPKVEPQREFEPSRYMAPVEPVVVTASVEPEPYTDTEPYTAITHHDPDETWSWLSRPVPGASAYAAFGVKTDPTKAPATTEPEEEAVDELHVEQTSISDFARPMPVRKSLTGTVGRQDWAYFNKDMGDLTDPYETPRLKQRERTGT